jgi:hypothetical protein
MKPKGNAIHGLEKSPRSPFKLHSRRVDYLKEMPRDFLKQCITDINMPSIQTIQHQQQGWQVRVAAQNGNVALLSLDDSSNLISAKAILSPDPDSVGHCKNLPVSGTHP